MCGPDMKKLLVFGAILFLLGLLNGVAVPLFENSRMGLSAHLAGVQNALVLFAFGLSWKYISLSSSALWGCAWLSIYGMYSIWGSLVLAAIWGTSSATPIAGAGYSGTDLQEWIVTALLYSGSVAIIVAAVLVLVGLVNNKSIAG
jgi:hydroxylaminobenzene mutase